MAYKPTCMDKINAVNHDNPAATVRDTKVFWLDDDSYVGFHLSTNDEDERVVFSLIGPDFKNQSPAEILGSSPIILVAENEDQFIKFVDGLIDATKELINRLTAKELFKELRKIAAEH